MVSKLLYSLFILTTLSLTLPRPAHALTRYQDLLYQDLSIQRNLVYGQAISPITHQSETLRLDLYQPAGDVTPNRSAIIWLHGGGFVTGSKDILSQVPDTLFTEDYAKRGYVVLAINYRLHNSSDNLSTKSPPLGKTLSWLSPGSKIIPPITVLIQAKFLSVASRQGLMPLSTPPTTMTQLSTVSLG